MNTNGFVTKEGYRIIYPGGKRIQEHRYIMEQHIGRKLLKSEVVHHIDHDKLNNSIENLELMPSQGEHIKRHFKWFRDETHKQCYCCKEIKSRSDFSPCSTPGKDRSVNICKPCNSKKSVAEKQRKRQGVLP